MAPMRLSVDASLSAVNRYGSAFGTRTLRRIVPSLAAYERISSSAPASAPDRPRVTFAITGKNDRTAAIIIFESGLVSPNHALNSGDRAMIGIAFAATAIGSSRPRATPQRLATSATRMPAAVPIRNPPIASVSVLRAALETGKCVSFQYVPSAAAIDDG